MSQLICFLVLNSLFLKIIYSYLIENTNSVLLHLLSVRVRHWNTFIHHVTIFSFNLLFSFSDKKFNCGRAMLRRQWAGSSEVIWVFTENRQETAPATSESGYPLLLRMPMDGGDHLPSGDSSSVTNKKWAYPYNLSLQLQKNSPPPVLKYTRSG